ncbi:MAG TPA: DNA topoisomerase III, partial [Planctomycetes bacterium]|nr:DNA topoisomerase III [Planctomycetota bacterium]
HKATTYPRTDCAYLPESMLGEASQVLEALTASDPDIEAVVGRADLSLRSRAWNDKKITAHHAIIPTTAPCDISRMNAEERRVYDLIRRRYLAQFYPRHEYDKTEATFDIAGESFQASGRRVRVPGWRALFGRNETDEDRLLPPLSEGDRCTLVDAKVERKETTPPRRYTEGTLIAAMKNAARLVEDPELKKRLRETAGIGTEATRAGIIQTLLDRGFLRKEKKHLVSTETGRALIDALPDPVKDPGTTALWEQALEDIAEGRGDMRLFLERQAEWVRALVGQVQQGAATIEASGARHPCPECGKPMRRRKGKNGWFWGCTGYPECRCTLPDAKGKPGKRKGKATAPTGRGATGKAPRPGAGKPCPECNKGRLVQRTVKNGKNAGRPFTGCTRYPDCRYFAWG